MNQLYLFFFQHINRNFHNLDRSINRSDSGIWYLEFDHNGASLMQDNPVIRDSHYVKCEGNYCGMPYMYPLIHVIDARWVWDIKMHVLLLWLFLNVTCLLVL